MTIEQKIDDLIMKLPVHLDYVVDVRLFCFLFLKIKGELPASITLIEKNNHAVQKTLNEIDMLIYKGDPAECLSSNVKYIRECKQCILDDVRLQRMFERLNNQSLWHKIKSKFIRECKK